MESSRRSKAYTKIFLNDLRNVDNEMDIMVKLSKGPGLLYGLDKLINRKKIENLLEERIRDQIEETKHPEDFSSNIEHEYLDHDDHLYNEDESHKSYDKSEEKEYEEIHEDVPLHPHEEPDNNYHRSDPEYERRTEYEKVKKLRKKKKMKAKQLLNEKIQLLTYLDRIKRKGVIVREELDVHSPFDEIKYEVMKHRQRRKIEFGKHIFTQILLDIIRIIEFISTKIEIVNLHLEGWHRNVRYHLDEYDDVIEEIVEKYSKGEGAGMSPEAKLGLLLLVSAVDHSASNSGVSSGIGSVKSLFGGGKQRDDIPQNASGDNIDEDILREIEEEKLKFA